VTVQTDTKREDRPAYKVSRLHDYDGTVLWLWRNWWLSQYSPMIEVLLIYDFVSSLGSLCYADGQFLFVIATTNVCMVRCSLKWDRRSGWWTQGVCGRRWHLEPSVAFRGSRSFTSGISLISGLKWTCMRHIIQMHPSCFRTTMLINSKWRMSWRGISSRTEGTWRVLHRVCRLLYIGSLLFGSYMWRGPCIQVTAIGN
jgi:hypothetical protein